jgi:putative ABC transport system permease protein
MTNIASLSSLHAVLLVIVSMVLTLIAGLIPAGIAAKKDPVQALRVE